MGPGHNSLAVAKSLPPSGGVTDPEWRIPSL